MMGLIDPPWTGTSVFPCQLKGKKFKKLKNTNRTQKNMHDLMSDEKDSTDCSMYYHIMRKE